MREIRATKATQKALRKFPEAIGEDFAKALDDIANDRTPAMSFKPLKNLAKGVNGVMELRVNGSPAYRVVYTVKVKDILYILHAFPKTTEGSDKPAMEVVVSNYKKYIK